MRLVLAAVGLGASLSLGVLSGSMVQTPPSDGDGGVSSYCTPEVVEYLAFLPYRVQVALQDAGVPITPTAIPYKQLRGRAWQCSYPDGGSALYLPRLAQLAEAFRPDLTQVVTLCSAGDAGQLCGVAASAGDPDGDGGTDALEDRPMSCACALDATCTGTYSDGGTGPAPLGATLPAGSFSGTGCRRKSCGALFRPRVLADGGTSFDESWPPACPGGG